MQNLTKMYVNMSQLDVFKHNVVSDERSYSNETFAKAAKILERGSVAVGQETYDKFKALVDELALLKGEAEAEEVSGCLLTK